MLEELISIQPREMTGDEAVTVAEVFSNNSLELYDNFQDNLEFMGIACVAAERFPEAFDADELKRLYFFGVMTPDSLIVADISDSRKDSIEAAFQSTTSAVAFAYARLEENVEFGIKAVERKRIAAELIEEYHPQKAARMLRFGSDMATWLWHTTNEDQYALLVREMNLDAVEIIEDAEIESENIPFIGFRYLDTGIIMKEYAEITHYDDDALDGVDEAVNALKKAQVLLGKTKYVGPQQKTVKLLAECYGLRYEITGTSEDAERALEYNRDFVIGEKVPKYLAEGLYFSGVLERDLGMNRDAERSFGESIRVLKEAELTSTKALDVERIAYMREYATPT